MQIQSRNLAYNVTKYTLNMRGVSLFQYAQHSIQIFQKLAHHSAQHTENHSATAPFTPKSMYSEVLQLSCQLQEAST